jgi:enoyl-[acyl-carrier protein] reductase II
MFEGDLQEGEKEIGQVASLLNELKSVKEIFEDLKQGFEKASRRMMNIKY